jgi:DNA helicase-2/ATP-dependent DNA helicase PcrA
MKYIADLHIHSHFSIATSKELVPEHLDLWGRIKGITVVGTGDFTHPGWTEELQNKLEPAEPGLFQVKPELRLDQGPILDRTSNGHVRFALSAEISTIYKKGDKTRKVHHLILASDFDTVARIQRSLGKIGNITSDGRPILGLDSRDLLEIALEASEDIVFIPAHIWTPWFSALGDKSGFNSIDECYGDLTGHIHAVETGLSSDPPMNWRCSFLDRFTIISNSDAHSPQKLGREANLLDTDLSYPGLAEAIQTGDPDRFLGTVEFFPQEGKYHHDGHRKCNISWDPQETAKHDSICPVCGKRVTVGVMNRVMQLADRVPKPTRAGRPPFHSMIPLKEILSEILGVGPNTKRVAAHYDELIQKAGSDFDVLLHQPISRVREMGGDVLAEAIDRMRTGRVHVNAGYDGEFGVIKAFTEEERQAFSSQGVLFPDMHQVPSKARKAKASAPRIQDYKKKQKKKKRTSRV